MTASTRTSHYEVLGVDPDASPRQLKSAYRHLVKERHPDAGGSEEAFEALQVAWRVLSDPDTREEYDSWLADVRPPAPGSAEEIQRRWEEREREVERRAWEARREATRQRAAKEAAAKEAAERRRREELEQSVNLHRSFSLACGALVILVSLLELLRGGIAADGRASLFAVTVDLPAKQAALSFLQMALAGIVIVGALLSRPPSSETGTPTRFRAVTGSWVFRTTIGVLAGALTLLVVVPFVVATLANTLIIVAVLVLLVALLLWQRS